MLNQHYALLVGFNGLGDPPIAEALEAVRVAVGDSATIEAHGSVAFLVNFKTPIVNLDEAIDKAQELFDVVAALPGIKKNGSERFLRVRPENRRN